MFGREMSVERSARGWELYYAGTDGKRRPADVVIPSFVTEAELVQYLDDLFHEAATARHPAVRRL